MDMGVGSGKRQENSQETKQNMLSITDIFPK